MLGTFAASHVAVAMLPLERTTKGSCKLPPTVCGLHRSYMISSERVGSLRYNRAGSGVMGDRSAGCLSCAPAPATAHQGQSGHKRTRRSRSLPTKSADMRLSHKKLALVQATG